jgi:hypothetical protein
MPPFGVVVPCASIPVSVDKSGNSSDGNIKDKRTGLLDDFLSTLFSLYSPATINSIQWFSPMILVSL